MILKILNKRFIRIILFFFTAISLIYLKNISYFDIKNIKNLFNKKWIPEKIIQSNDIEDIFELLTKNKIKNFSFSKNFLNSLKKYEINTISNQNYIYFRTITYVYPILFSLESKNIISFYKDDISINCKLIDKLNNVNLQEC
ncbi:hypothetical protein OAT25_01525 [Candidatus Pelagibacter sp.]|jgi:hypothetical protein|nr:hypothetical protein [Candidatus Pelagibacter sp.]